MKRFIEEADRGQLTLLPESLDDYIDEGNPVRAIEAFAAHLDLDKLGFETTPADTGRPGYHASSLLKLFIYGYPHEDGEGFNLLLNALPVDGKLVLRTYKDKPEEQEKIIKGKFKK